VRRDSVIIEVGLNEAASRSVVPGVPFSPSECAADAVACAHAGAAIVHWHARDPATGDQRLGDVALSGEFLDLVRGSGVLAYPSYPIDVPIDQRLDHVWALRASHDLELAPVDVGSVNIVVWDERSKTFVGVELLRDGGVIENPLAFVLDALRRAHDLGMIPTLGSFDVGHTRTVGLLAESGLLPERVLLKIFLTGTLAMGPQPSEDALDLHLRQLPAGSAIDWIAVPYAITDPVLIDRLIRHALSRGGGVRVGIGDNPAVCENTTNAALVERVVRLAADAGRQVATAADVRAG
jgi:3-keto-5-aminohexanoate cleavage enzyme